MSRHPAGDCDAAWKAADRRLEAGAPMSDVGLKPALRSPPLFRLAHQLLDAAAHDRAVGIRDDADLGRRDRWVISSASSSPARFSMTS